MRCARVCGLPPAGPCIATPGPSGGGGGGGGGGAIRSDTDAGGLPQAQEAYHIPSVLYDFCWMAEVTWWKRCRWPGDTKGRPGKASTASARQPCAWLPR